MLFRMVSTRIDTGFITWEELFWALNLDQKDQIKNYATESEGLLKGALLSHVVSMIYFLGS